MSEYRQHISENRSEKYRMSALVEAQTLVREIAEPRAVGDSVKISISKSARRLGFTFSRAKDIWYGAARRIDAHEIDKLRSVAKQRHLLAARESVLALRNSLARTGEGMDSELAASLDHTLCQLGAEIRTVDDER